MIVNIHGEPYTTVEQDLDLVKIRTSFAYAVRETVQRALDRFDKDGSRLEVHLESLYPYFEIAYCLGRVVDGKTNDPVSETERRRFEGLLSAFTACLDDALRECLDRAKDGKATLRMKEINELIDQAYYMGREDS